LNVAVAIAQGGSPSCATSTNRLPMVRPSRNDRTLARSGHPEIAGLRNSTCT
jgi:hypothetical protein